MPRALPAAFENISRHGEDQRMKIQHRLFALAASMVLIWTVAAAATGGKHFKWKDKDGVTHIGDSIPPEYASQAHEELNDQGVPIRVVPRQPTPAEADAARKAADEEARRQQRDSFLLHSYTAVGEIEQLRDERIALIESQMELLRSSLASNEQQLGGLQNRMKSFRPYSAAANARPLSDTLATQVVRALSDRRSMTTQLQKYEADKAVQKESFGADIARYKQLTAGKQPR